MGLIKNSEQLGAYAWPKHSESYKAKCFLEALMTESPEKYVKNVQTQAMGLVLNGELLPVTCNETAYGNAYVCSPYTHYIAYAIEELKELKEPHLEKVLKGILLTLGTFLKWGKINQVLHINNWLLSTNLYVPFDKTVLKHGTEGLTRAYGKHALIFRSINGETNAEEMQALLELGYDAIASRRVYILEKGCVLKSRAKSILKKDRALMDLSLFQWTKASTLSAAEISHVVSLYNQLYLEKYSYYNPQFTEAFTALALKENLLEFHLLKYNNETVGVIGFFIRKDVMTTPYFGYDTTKPKEWGLYRILSLKLIDIAFEREVTLHQSSGAGAYKKCRGAKPTIEYNMVYSRHLPLYRRLVWKSLKCLMNGIAVPLMEKKGL